MGYTQALAAPALGTSRGELGMARVVIECPSCNTRLETSSDNVGRDGQCPACEEIFSIPPASGVGTVSGRRTALKTSAAAEYQDFSVLFEPTMCQGECMRTFPLYHLIETSEEEVNTPILICGDCHSLMFERMQERRRRGKHE